VIFLGDFSFVRIFLKNYRVTMTTTLDRYFTLYRTARVFDGVCADGFSVLLLACFDGVCVQ
jgi:hypothetical protein